MRETNLRYEPHASTIGAALDLESLEVLTANPLALAGLLTMLDERGVVCIRTEQALEPGQLAAIERYFGTSATRGTCQPLVPGTDFLGDFSIGPKFDDGRPRRVAPTDFIHIDTMPNGPAAYGVHATLAGTSVAPMRFADMRAVYAGLAEAQKARIAGLRARHSVPELDDGTPAPWTMQPLAARHPRSGAALLLLPNRYRSWVEGLPDQEAADLIGQLWRITDAAPGCLELHLRPNTLIIWDNITCTHTNPGFARSLGRVVWFFNILNDRPVAPVAA